MIIEGFKVTFEIAPYPKVMLLNGWDEIGVTLTYEDKISQYELTVNNKKMSLDTQAHFFIIYLEKAWVLQLV